MSLHKELVHPVFVVAGRLREWRLRLVRHSCEVLSERIVRGGLICFFLGDELLPDVVLIL